MNPTFPFTVIGPTNDTPGVPSLVSLDSRSQRLLALESLRRLLLISPSVSVGRTTEGVTRSPRPLRFYGEIC